MPNDDSSDDLSFERWTLELALDKKDLEAADFVSSQYSASALPEHLELKAALAEYISAPLSGAEAKERDDFMEELQKAMERAFKNPNNREKMAAQLRRLMHNSGE